MTKKILHFIVLIIAFPCLYSQQIKVVNNKTNAPLCDVIVFDLKGNFKAKTSIEGLFEKKAIQDIGEKFIINYKTTFTDTISILGIKNDEIRLDLDKIYLDEVVITNQKSDKFIVEGYFNSYLTNNNQTTWFVEGIIQYFFDSKSKKYKGKNILQYRIFELDEKLNPMDKKNTSTYIFENFKLPELKQIYDLAKIKEDAKNNFKEISLDNESKRINYQRKILEDKTMTLFGYTLSNFIQSTNISFYSNKTVPEDIESYSFSESFLFKHKKESDFNTYFSYSNFYPMTVTYTDKFEFNGVTIKKDHSYYNSDFLDKIPYYKKDKISFQKLVEVKNLLN